MTVSEMPLANTTPGGVADSPGVRARVRARVPATLRRDNSLAGARRVAAPMRSDLRRWWLYAARPASLRAWLRAQKVDVKQVPARSERLRVVWLVDNWTLGLLLRSLAIGLHLAAGGVTYLADGRHPARKWVAFGMAFAALAWVVLG